ncbi:hypothetical protein HMI54_005392 [Coelomomyces lativittatus]|nr:hypothetical protein HMI55_001541 [Coelomomyces lativittatus]KAJ1506051.1 hypothetical protein HMI54_005392 [Coelomomyces lativittatus]KAJ1514620.1 hypothetical protein HMI56_000081 [Coelomomyces lativittatus]
MIKESDCNLHPIGTPFNHGPSILPTLPFFEDSAIKLSDANSPSTSTHQNSQTSDEPSIVLLPTDLYLPLNPKQPAHVRLNLPKNCLSPTSKLAILTAAVACSKHVNQVDLEKVLSSWLADVQALTTTLDQSESHCNQLKLTLGTQLGTLTHLRQELEHHQYQLKQLQMELQKRTQMAQECQTRFLQSQEQIESLKNEVCTFRARSLEAEQNAAIWSQRAHQLESQVRSNPDLHKIKEHYLGLLDQRDREHAKVLNSLCFLCRKQLSGF